MGWIDDAVQIWFETPFDLHPNTGTHVVQLRPTLRDECSIALNNIP